ncbi:MAG: hypothetical protein U0324_08235 [Polyangiales bacterium]
MRPALPPFRRALSTLLLAIVGLAPAGCAPEVTFCQVEGAKYEHDDGMITVWVNPILFVRVYRDELFETTNFRVTVLNGTEQIYSGTVRNGTNDPGGTPLCILSLPVPDGGGPPDPMAQRITGIQLPRRFPRTARLALSVKIDMSDTSGTSRSFTLPVERIRYVQEPMPGFSCASTRCGR